MDGGGERKVIVGMVGNEGIAVEMKGTLKLGKVAGR